MKSENIKKYIFNNIFRYIDDEIKEKGFKPCKETLFIISKAIHDIDDNGIASLNKESYYIVD